MHRRWFRSAACRPRQLPAAADLGAPVPCNIASDDYVARKHQPFLTQTERATIIDAIRYIDYVHLSQTTTEDVPRMSVPATTSRAPIGVAGCHRSRTRSAPTRDRDRLLRHSHAIVNGDSRALHRMIDAVVSHHMNPFRSGVSRFNELRPSISACRWSRLHDAALQAPLLSFKVSELEAEDIAALGGGARLPGRPSSCSCTSGAIPAREADGRGGAPRAVRQPRDRHALAQPFCGGAGPWPDFNENGRPRPLTWRCSLRGGAQDPHDPLSPAARPAGGDRALYAIRVSAANHETATMRDTCRRCPRRWPPSS